MKIRVIQLINNYFKDKNDINENRTNALGEYCTFGYFDALHVEKERELYDTEDNLIWKNIDEIAVNTLDGTCNRRNLVCIVEEEDKDIRFWNRAEESPYLFISLISIKHGLEPIMAIQKKMAAMSDDETAMLYYSYNHSELVIAKLAKSYIAGMRFVLEQRKQFNALNMYSIFSVREAILKPEAEIQNEIECEKVKVRLRLMIKNDREIDGFLQSLWETLFKRETQTNETFQTKSFEKFYTLGSSDMVVEIDSVEMYKLLSCYGMGNLLTHTNEQFEKAVYNIETEILIKDEESIKHGKSVDSRGNDDAERTLR